MAKRERNKEGKKEGKNGAKKNGTGKNAKATDVRSLLRVPPGTSVDLSAVDSSATPGGPVTKQAALAEIEGIGLRLAALQERLFAQSTAGDRRRLLLVLQGMDTSGKGGTVKHVIGQFNPAGCRIHAFKAPTVEEKRHPFLWRIRRHLPEPGEIGIFDRSHYEDVLIARVRELVPASVWARRYGVINRFESALVEDGVTIVKVFLHIGQEEQRDRLLARLDNPDKYWKFDVTDIDERALWPNYQEAYQDVLERCGTEAAPWYLVPADHKWYRNWAVSRLLLEHLEAMDPRYPEAHFDLAKCRERLRNA